tara:strand:- start:661 stop:1467 length:807 start_codon:yes stop_codon:yes gene_type:complete
MKTELLKDLIRSFTDSAISGVTRTQLRRSFQESYNLSDKDMDTVEQLCYFRKAPEWINYDAFYDNPIMQKGEKINYPFTQLFCYKNFLTEKECKALIKNIDESVRPSTISNNDDSQKTSDYRTSQTADLHYFPEKLILDLNEKLEDLMELDPFIGEALQAQKYNPGQYYKEHWDFFPPRETPQFKIYCEWMGQRTWTTMIYLNNVEEGGETYFKHLKLKVKPEQGLLLAWNNLYRNGKPNYKTMHEALPPIKGDKYVITKWWRSWSLI